VPSVKTLVLTCLILINSVFLQAQFDFNQNCKQAYQCIISLQLREGERLLEKEKQNHPSNGIILLLENYSDFLDLYISEDASAFAKKKHVKSERLSQLEGKNKSSPYYHYSLAVTHMQWGFIYLKNGEYLNAGLEFRSANTSLERNKKAYPGFLPDQIISGLLHVTAGTIPDAYRWLTDLSGLSGTVEQGIGELRSALNTMNKRTEYEFLRAETMFYLTMITLSMQKDKIAEYGILAYLDDPRFKELLKTNLLASYAKANLLLRTGHSDQAIEVLLNRPRGDNYLPYPWLDYLTGLAKLHRLDQDAIPYFQKFLAATKGKRFIKSAWQKIGWQYLLAGKTDLYEKNLLQVLSHGSEATEEDKNAQKEATSRSKPNLVLLRARLLFDGGYYERALSLLQKEGMDKVVRNNDDLIEYAYRMGRIYHEWGKKEQSIPFYEMTIRYGSDEKSYYAANACLQLGLIYENAGNKQEAIRYLNKCLSLDFEDYRTSIRQKAKAGLSRLSK